MINAQHAHIYRIHNLHFIFGEIFFLKIYQYSPYQGEYDVGGDIQGWHMHQGVDHGYHNLTCQAVSIKGVQQLPQGMPAVCSI
jgi:hypothetical protein